MLLRLAPALTLALMLGPVLAGLAGTLLPAFGYLPVVGGKTFGLEPWRRLLDTPGLAGAVVLSFRVGFLSTAVSLALVILFCAGWHGTVLFRRLQRLLSPLLAVPHVTVALGLAFLIAPSGWLMRLLSPWATGFDRPPDWLIVNDPAGLSLALGLVLKETPFLLLMTLSALGQIDAARARTLARTLGYGPVAAWLKAVLPRVYPQLRLPIFAVLAFSLSVVDMSLVLGPGTPPPLAVLLLRWFNDPDLGLRLVASAGAVLQLALVLAALALWLGLERLAARLGLIWLRRGGRGRRDGVWRMAGAVLPGLTLLLALLGLAGMALWSFAGFWRFPEALPPLTLANWLRYLDDVLAPLWQSALLGLVSATLALALVVACLEHEPHQARRPTVRALWLLYLPLIVPQIAFLFGFQTLLVGLRLDGGWTALLWAHLVFVLPYVFLSLADPYRAWDERYARSARCLGAGPLRVWWRIKRPMLARPMLIALAVGFAVSIAQYLPTLFAGAGRFSTLTTEAVTLSAGGNRRIIGIYALLQMLLPMLAFALAQGLPAWWFRHRRGMRIDT